MPWFYLNYLYWVTTEILLLISPDQKIESLAQTDSWRSGSGPLSPIEVAVCWQDSHLVYTNWEQSVKTLQSAPFLAPLGVGLLWSSD